MSSATVVISGLTAFLLVLIELLAVIDQLIKMWRDKNDVANRNYERVRSTFAAA
jgi:hypothetical protein